MITNKEDFIKKRKTRIETLEERITNADLMIKELNQGLQEEGLKEIERLEKVLKELRYMKSKLEEDESHDNKEIEMKINNLSNESLLAIAIEKVKIIQENDRLLGIQKEREAYIKKLEQEIMKQNMDLENAKRVENESLLKISTLEDQIRVMKNRAFGYDIAKKYEYFYNNSKNNSGIEPVRVEDENLAYSYWEKENLESLKHPTKLEQIAKQKEMWISNSGAKIDKLINDIDTQKRVPSGLSNLNPMNNPYKQPNEISTNLRKISPMILNSKAKSTLK